MIPPRQYVSVLDEPTITMTYSAFGWTGFCQRSYKGKSPARRPAAYLGRRGWAALCRLRGCDSRPGRRPRTNRLRHLLTIWRGVSSRDAMTSLERPSPASRTILARMTSQYGDVYLRAIASRTRCSSLESLIAYGLLLGIGAYIPRMPAYQAAPLFPQKTYVVVFAKHTSPY